jgi:TM2 domain-containing membrane protein YozV
VPSLESSAGAKLDEDQSYGGLKSSLFSPPPPVAQTSLSINSGPAIPDARYLPLPQQPKSPALAALLSFLLIGMGQVYLGQVEKGLTMLGVVLLLMLSVVLGPLGFVLLLLNVFDAFLLAKKIKAGQPLRKWEFFFQSR